MSVATTPFSPPKVQPAAVPEPSWEIAKLFPYQGQWSEGVYLALAMDINRLVELSSGSIKVIELPGELHQDSRIITDQSGHKPLSQRVDAASGVAVDAKPTSTLFYRICWM